MGRDGIAFRALGALRRGRDNLHSSSQLVTKSVEIGLGTGAGCGIVVTRERVACRLNAPCCARGFLPFGEACEASSATCGILRKMPAERCPDRDEGGDIELDRSILEGFASMRAASRRNGTPLPVSTGSRRAVICLRRQAGTRAKAHGRGALWAGRGWP